VFCAAADPNDVSELRWTAGQPVAVFHGQGRRRIWLSDDAVVAATNRALRLAALVSSGHQAQRSRLPGQDYLVNAGWQERTGPEEFPGKSVICVGGLLRTWNTSKNR